MDARRRSEQGFSLIEAAVVFTILAIVSALVMRGYSSLLPQLRSDTAEQMLLTRMRSVRDLALTQRIDYQVSFPSPTTLQVYQIKGGSQLVDTLTLPYNFRFMLFPGEPDTPDGFGNSSAIDLNGGKDTSLIFLGDGSVVDADGNPVNGSLFIGLPGNSSTAHAVTILGATGRMRGYRYDGKTFQ